MIYVTHDQTEALSLATKIIVLDKGEIQQIGTPAEVYDCPANEFVASFIGSPQMNLISMCKLCSKKNSLYSLSILGCEYQLESLAPIEFVDVGFRPEDISLVEDENGTIHITHKEFLGDTYIVKQAIKAGYTAAAVTVAIQIAPEIYKAIDYLIKNGHINVQHLKKTGVKAITAGAEGFLRGSISCSVLLMCEKGLLGEAFKGADPTMVGTIVAVVLETVKNSIMVAAGKMTAREMGAALTDSVVVSVGYVAGAKLGGIIGQALGFELPVVGYLIGSLIGCAFAAAYNIGKNKLISFCVDTGFTCFGLVEQNYELPDEILEYMGIKTITIPRTEVKRTPVKTTSVPTVELNKTAPETIDFMIVRRGVIGVNKIGYVIG